MLSLLGHLGRSKTFCVQQSCPKQAIELPCFLFCLASEAMVTLASTKTSANSCRGWIHTRGKLTLLSATWKRFSKKGESLPCSTLLVFQSRLQLRWASPWADLADMVVKRAIKKASLEAVLLSCLQPSCWGGRAIAKKKPKQRYCHQAQRQSINSCL